jgi:spore germination protein YaaH
MERQITENGIAMMKILRPLALLVAVVIACCVFWTGAAADTIGGNAPFAHEARRLGLMPTREPGPGTTPLARRSKTLSTQVMGFYPYWSSTDPEDLHYDLLTTIAWFGASIGDDGHFTDLFGWPDGELIDAAHANGVGVVLTVTNFSETSIANLLSSELHRTNAVTNIVDEVSLAGADGVNIDFEGLPVSQKQNFVVFITALRTALDALLPGAHLSVDTPAVDWDGAFNFDELAAQADFLFIMAYDYHWRSGDPGPVSPLHAGATWGDYGIAWTLDDYEFYITPYDLGSVILGLPLYGYNWPTTDDSVPGTSRAGASAVIYATACNMAGDPSYGSRLYDAEADSPFLVWHEDGDGWRQLWYEDAESLALRFDYAKTRGAGGVGFWALGYAGEDCGLWEAVEDAFNDTDDDVDDDIDDDVDDDIDDDTDDDTDDDADDDIDDDADDDVDDDIDDDTDDDTDDDADDDIDDDADDDVDDDIDDDSGDEDTGGDGNDDDDGNEGECCG